MIRHCKLKYCINDCHVMSPLLSRQVINIFSKLFYQLKISLNILRESLLALLQLKYCHYEDLKKSATKSGSRQVIQIWIASFTLAMTKKVKIAMTKFFAMIKVFAMTCIFVITRAKPEVIYSRVDCFTPFAMTKIFNLINIGDCSLNELFSVIYKKSILGGHYYV